jgi:DNA-binding response OmpR family regulator
MPVERIVVAEDDAPIRALLLHHLRGEGYRCTEAAAGASALRAARSGADLLILDVGLPVVDGFEVLRVLRREQRDVPVLLLTARAEEIDRIVGLEIGADDYVTKPFSPREVIARVRAIARRAGIAASGAPALLRFDELEIDEAAREARIEGRTLDLKPREFALLLELALHPGVALSRRMLLERVWGYEFNGDERTVDVHVRRLRLKIERYPGAPALLQTIHGFGYKFARA